MKIRDLFESGNTSVAGVMNTIRAIYTGSRTNTSPNLCHAHTAKNIDPAQPDDMIVLFGYGNTVAHSAIIHNGRLVDHFEGVSSSTLLPSGNLLVTVGSGETDELEQVFSMTVGDFLTSIEQQ